jgi:RNA polymerase sigma-70 factor (ECF subfamily)
VGQGRADVGLQGSEMPKKKPKRGKMNPEARSDGRGTPRSDLRGGTSPRALAPDSFEEIHASHREGILRYLHRMTRDLSLAEELTQESFLRVSRGLPSFRGDSKLSTWLYRIATNVYLDQRRKEASRVRDPEALPPALIDPPDPASLSGSGPKLPDRLFEDSEMGSCIREFVDRLAPDQRAVVILHDLEGLKNTEIAQILDCSLDTVKIRVHRARQKLKALLGEHCDFDYSQEDELRCDRKQPSDRQRS